MALTFSELFGFPFWLLFYGALGAPSSLGLGGVSVLLLSLSFWPFKRHEIIMTIYTSYVCEHCHSHFETPCEEHEVECLEDKKRAALLKKTSARIDPLCNIMLGETTDDPVGAKINGVTFLITTPFSKKAIKAFSVATELISTSTKPSERDAALLKTVNEILSS